MTIKRDGALSVKYSLFGAGESDVPYVGVKKMQAYTLNFNDYIFIHGV